MASSGLSSDEVSPPIHIPGTLLASPPDYVTIATFSPGTFLENLAVRRDGTILASDMMSGSIWYIDPHNLKPQETIELVHKFELGKSQVEETVEADEGNAQGETGHVSYATTPAAEAIFESPLTPDVFYITSGIHGNQGTWWIYELDMRPFVPGTKSAGLNATLHVQADLKTTTTEVSAATARGKAKITRVAPIPQAKWLNGGTALPHPTQPLILVAESYQGRLYSYNLKTQKVDVWLDHTLLGKVTTRPPWPGINGVQYYHHGEKEWVYFTNSDRAILGRISLDRKNDELTPKQWFDSHGDEHIGIQVMATGCCGDDLCLDTEGNVYVATNPVNTVLKFPKIGHTLSSDSPAGARLGGKLQYDNKYGLRHEPDRQIILGLRHSFGSFENDRETTGPTAVAFAHPDDGTGDLYVVTCGGIINPLDGTVREAKVLKIQLTSHKVE